MASHTIGDAAIFLHTNKILSAPVMDPSVPAGRPAQERCLGIVDVIDCEQHRGPIATGKEGGLVWCEVPVHQQFLLHACCPTLMFRIPPFLPPSSA